MNLSDEVDLEDYVSRPDKISAADVSAFHYVKYSWNMHSYVFVMALKSFS
jgi:hypothetical protein